MRAWFSAAVTAAGLIALAAGAAQAADMPVKAPLYKAPPPVAAYNWTGFYIGGHLGYAWADKEQFAPDGHTVSTHHPEGLIGGGQIGFNWQTRQWVLGVEAQASWGDDVRQGVRIIDPVCSPVFLPNNLLAVPLFRIGTTVENLGTIAGRVGYAWDRWLPYVKGGAAWANDTHRIFHVDNGAENLIATATATRWGWTAGAGVEHAFLGNWSAKLEYNYMDFGREKVVFTRLIGGTFTHEIEQSVHVVKAGVNYRFGSSPVVARY